MNILLVFFALPIATIIISIALQKILKCPLLVAAIIFAIFLIVTFIINNLNFLVATIIYTIISFITAFIVCIICRLLRRCNRRERISCCFCDDDDDNYSRRTELISLVNSRDNENCNCQDINTSSGVSARVNVIPNSSTNGCIPGCCRRR